MKYTYHIRQELADVVKVPAIVNVNLFDFPQDFQTESDRHPFWEIVYVVNGKLNIEAENYTGPLKRGQMILHRPNELHSLACAATNNSTLIIIGFFVNTMLPIAFSKSPTNLSGTQAQKLADIVKEGREIFLPPYDVSTFMMKKRPSCAFGAEQMFKNLIECFLIDIIRENTAQPGAGKENGTFSIEEVKRYLDTNYNEKILINHLAFMFATNRSTLCQKFRAATGMSILDYLAKKKTQEAMVLLSKDDKTITEISELLKFQSIHYFTRFFKKHVGVSPSVYKKQHGKGPKK